MSKKPPKVRMLKPRISEHKSAMAGKTATKRLRGKGLQTRNRRVLLAAPLCTQCRAEGRITAATQVDHRTPLWAGGTDTGANWNPLCERCHADKTAREAAERAKSGER